MSHVAQSQPDGHADASLAFAIALSALVASAIELGMDFPTLIEHAWAHWDDMADAPARTPADLITG